MKKAALHNLGCKVNAYETEAMQEMLEKAGYEIVPFKEGADLYVINTCTVTNIADRKSRQMLHRARKMNPDAVVVAAGCYVQAKEKEIQVDDCIDIVLGNNKKQNLIEALEEYERTHNAVAAPVVKKIFQYFIDGMTYAEIARKLNADGYLCPKAYKLDKAGKANEKSATWTWSGGTVHKILENQYYAGDSVHNQFTNDSWAAQRQKMNQKEEWIIIKNTHEALVSRKDFDEVQEKIGHIVKRVNEARKSNGNNVRDFNFFKQKIVCADCGKTMYLYGKTKGNHRRFYCGNNKLHGKCTPHSITDLEVNDYVLRVIRAHINVYVENVDLIRRLNQRQESIKKYDVFNREIKKCRKELEKVAVHRERLFEDYVCRIIDAEQYETFSKQDAETEKEIQNNMEILLKHQVGYEKNFHTEEEWETLINKYRNTRTLTKEMVNAFVEKIEIHESGSITVRLVYDDMLEELRKYAKEREAELCQ